MSPGSLDDGPHQYFAGSHHAATQNDQLKIQHVNQICTSKTEPTTGLIECQNCGFVTSGGRFKDRFGSQIGYFMEAAVWTMFHQFERCPPNSACRSQSFQTSCTAATTWPPARI